MLPHPNGMPYFPGHLAASAMVTRITANRLDVNDVIDVVPEQGWRPDEAGGFTAILHDEGTWHYFHFMETLIWLWVIQHRFLAGARLRRIVFTWPWNNPGQNHVQPCVLQALYKQIEIVDARTAMPARFEQVLIIDRTWAKTRLNKFVEDCTTYGRPWVMAMGRTVRSAVGAHHDASHGNRILYVRRKPPRCLTKKLEARLIVAMQQYGPVTEADFDAIPWEQQVRLAASNDVLVGVHGNGLTNALWMRPGSLVLEFFPQNVHHYDYQFIAELCGLDYFGLEGPHVFPAFYRGLPPYGHTHGNKSVAAIPLSAVAFFLNLRATRP